MPSTAINGILSGLNYMVMISCCPRYKRLGNNTYSSFNDVSSDDWGEQTRQVGQAVGERHKNSSETRGDVQVVNLYKNIGKNLDTGNRGRSCSKYWGCLFNEAISRLLLVKELFLLQYGILQTNREQTSCRCGNHWTWCHGIASGGIAKSPFLMIGVRLKQAIIRCN